MDVQNILSEGIAPGFQNLSDAQFANKFRAIVFKSAVWGVPFGIFWHVNELSPHQVGIMLDTLRLSERDLNDEHATGELLAGHAPEFWDDLTMPMRLPGPRWT